MPAADLAGAVAFSLVALWPLLKGRRAMLLGQAASAVAFGVHYLLLKAHTGAAMTALSLIQGLSALPSGRSRVRTVVFAATVPAMLGLVGLTWHGWSSVCAAAGLLLATAGRWQGTALGLRLGFFASGIAWICHDVITGSQYGLAADLFCMAALIIGALREHRQRRQPAAVQRKPA
ncbi:YgjV family protein [Azospirillum canadense]|uniref:YgjV family protein n=1 Tax=Azospirillum canadense TaxID=403962 RepID=UPI0022268E50|nr:YgjV family protein [Azospirillum canadense]MCW2240705.1 hypothetical protein [Azospirillum canadense]